MPSPPHLPTFVLAALAGLSVMSNFLTSQARLKPPETAAARGRTVMYLAQWLLTNILPLGGMIRFWARWNTFSHLFFGAS